MKQPNKTKQTLKEYLKAFFEKAHKDTVNHFFWSHAHNRSAEDRLIRKEEVRSDFGELIGEGITFKKVDSYGGEGKGEDYWSVYKFSLGEEICWVKFIGWYSSYNGSEYSKFSFVKPKEVVVTRYIEV